ncbi:hypothetical protein R6Q57_021621 [Mikania cordata]
MSKIIGEQLRSPYVERSVVLGTKLSKEERMICQYVFHPKNDPHTFLFITNSDTEFYKVITESLFPKVYIHTGVLEAFVNVLNADEKQRGPSSPFRLFLPPNILPLPLLEKGVSENTRKNLFAENMGMMLTNLHIKNLNKIDLVFNPIIHNEHVFVLVFDMKNPSFEVIDNMATCVIKLERYSHIHATMVI